MTESQDKSTKRPWKVGFAGTAIDSHGRTIVKTAGDTEERLANAALIVSAVNLYDAHRECVEAFTALRDDIETIAPNYRPKALLERIDAALANLEKVNG